MKLQQLFAGYGMGLAVAATAQTPPEEKFELRVPSGYVVTVDCARLGPGRVETLEFWRQLEPKQTDLPAIAARDNTNPHAIAWLKDHLNQHGVGAAHLKAIAARCRITPLAGAADKMPRFDKR